MTGAGDGVGAALVVPSSTQEILGWAAFVGLVLIWLRGSVLVVDSGELVRMAPTYELVLGWIMRTIEGGGAQIRLGARLGSVFERAGLSGPTLRLESVIASGPAAIDAVHLVTDLVATPLPNIERTGIANASEVELPSLAQRILAEVGADGTLIGRAEIAAWTTV
jgi:hypothetical protein